MLHEFLLHELRGRVVHANIILHEQFLKFVLLVEGRLRLVAQVLHGFHGAIEDLVVLGVYDLEEVLFEELFLW